MNHRAKRTKKQDERGRNPDTVQSPVRGNGFRDRGQYNCFRGISLIGNANPTDHMPNYSSGWCSKTTKHQVGRGRTTKVMLAVADDGIVWGTSKTKHRPR
jgi:hypothetical protein